MCVISRVMKVKVPERQQETQRKSRLLMKTLTGVSVCPQVWEGQNIVKLVRMMLGETNPADSKPGSIRGDLCINIGR